MDEEFQKIIHKIKPLAKVLPRNSDERHHVTMWIKKLLSDKSDKASRNHYAQLLLNSLLKTRIQAPFTASPPSGALPQVKDELDKLLHISPALYPTTTLTNQSSTITSGVYSSGGTPKFASTPKSDRLRRRSPPLPRHKLTPNRQRTRKILTFSSSDSSSADEQEGRTRSRKTNFSLASISDNNDSDELPDAFTESCLSPHKTIPPTTSIGTSPKLVCVTEKPAVPLVHVHNDALKNFLDQKNIEIESIRMECSQKTCELEFKCQELEVNVAQLGQQLLVQKDDHRKEIDQVKQTSQQQLQRSKANLKKKFQNIITDLEREKIQLENQRSLNMQSVLDDANNKLSNMKTEKQTLTQTIHTLECQTQQLNQQLDITRQTKDAYLREKKHLQEECSTLDNSLKLATKKARSLEDQCARINAAKSAELNDAQTEAEKALLLLKHQMEIDQSRAADKVASLQDYVQKLENTLEEVKTNQKQKIMEIESSAWKQVNDKETEINVLRDSWERKEFESTEALSALKITFQGRESKMKELKARCDSLTRKLEKTAKDSKNEVEMAEKEYQTNTDKIKDHHHQAMDQKLAIIKQLELNVSDLNNRLQGQSAQLEAEHKEKQAIEMYALLEKHVLQIQHLQHDHEVKMALAEESTASLKLQVKTLQEDHERITASHAEEIRETKEEKEWELNQLRSHNEETESIHAQTLANSKATSDELESRIQHLQQTYESQLSQLKANIEQRQAPIKQEYEDTIRALKVQVHLLTQRADVLQKQLAQLRTCSTLRKHIKSGNRKY